jgi:hypothetical protein
MNVSILSKSAVVSVAWLIGAAAVAQAAPAPASTMAPMLAGTWTLVAADVLHPDGRREHDFGAAPKGLLMIDAAGRYSLQIFKSERPRFASGDKSKGTPAEYEAAVMGSSTHFGRVSVDAPAGVITFTSEAASYPNWEGEKQSRKYTLRGDELSYRVAPRPNGDVPISVWRRAN